MPGHADSPATSEKTKPPRSLLIERQPDGLCVLQVQGAVLKKLLALLASGEEKNISGNFSLEFTGRGVEHGAPAVAVNALRLQAYQGIVYFLGGLRDRELISLPFQDHDTLPEAQSVSNITDPEMPVIEDETSKRRAAAETEIPEFVPRPQNIMIEYNADRLRVPKGKLIPTEKLTADQKKTFDAELHVRAAMAVSTYEGEFTPITAVLRFLQKVFEQGEVQKNHTDTHLKEMHLLNAYPQETFMLKILESMVERSGDSKDTVHRNLKELLQGLRGSLLTRIAGYVGKKQPPAAEWANKQLAILKKKK